MNMQYRDLSKGERRLKRKRSWDDHGGLEGLPLQLIIMMVIAGVGIGIVISWLTVFSEKPLSTLEYVSAESEKGKTDVLKNGEEYTIKIRALNTDQKNMNGVTVILEGPGVSKIATTNSYGLATFEKVRPKLGPNENVGLISVTATYKSWSIAGPTIGIEAQ